MEWNNILAWSDSEGGLTGQSFPVAGDTTIFSDANVNNCTLTADVACAAITNSTAVGLYTGTLNAATYNVTVSGSFVWNKGGLTLGTGTWSANTWNCNGITTLTAGTSTVKITGATATWRGGGTAFVYYDIWMSVDCTAVNDVTANWAVSHNFRVDAGKTYLFAGSSRIGLLKATATLTLDGTIDGGAGTGNVVQVQDGACINFPTGGTLSRITVLMESLTADITIPARTYVGLTYKNSHVATSHIAVMGAGTFTLSGPLLVNAATAGDGTLDAATNSPTISCGDATTAIDFTGTGAGSEVFQGGTANVITCNGLVDFTGGTFTKNTCELVMAGAGKNLTCNAQGLYNLTCNDSTAFLDALNVNPILKCIIASKTLTFASSVDHVINDFNLNGQNTATRVVLAPGTAATPWRLTLAQAAAPTAISNVSVDYSDATASPAAVKADDGTNLDGGHNTNWTFTAGGVTYYVNAFESVSVVEGLGKLPALLRSESLTLGDSIIRGPGRTVQEGVTLGDNLLKAAVRSLLESLGVTDEVFRRVSRLFTETMTAEDWVLTQRQFQKLVTESVLIGDTLLPRAVSKLLEEIVAVVDMRTVLATRALIETVMVADVRTLLAARLLLESILASDSITLVEGVAVVYAQVIARLLDASLQVKLADGGLDRRSLDATLRALLGE